MKAGLPVDLDRLKTEFPDVLERARAAQQKTASGAALSKDEQLLVRYMAAMAKMQRSTVKKVQ